MLCGDWAWKHPAGTEQQLGAVPASPTACPAVCPASPHCCQCRDAGPKAAHLVKRVWPKKRHKVPQGNGFHRNSWHPTALMDLRMMPVSFRQVSLNSSKVFTPTTLGGSSVSKTQQEHGNSHRWAVTNPSVVSQRVMLCAGPRAHLMSTTPQSPLQTRTGLTLFV